MIEERKRTQKRGDLTRRDEKREENRTTGKCKGGTSRVRKSKIKIDRRVRKVKGKRREKNVE